MIHVIRTRSECKSCSIFGRARTTTVESRAAMKEPTVVTESATHLYAGFFIRNTPAVRKEMQRNVSIIIALHHGKANCAKVQSIVYDCVRIDLHVCLYE